MKPKVLIVDDEISLQKVYGKFFINEGFEVTPLSDGSNVLETLKSDNYDLVMLDIMMPIKSGIDLLEEIKSDESTENIPVIMLSAYEDDRLLTKAMELGASRYIVKGMLDPIEVINIAKEVISS